MSTRLYVDMNTGEIRAALGAAPIALMGLTAQDVLPIEIVFVSAGVEVTSTVLANNAALLLSLRAMPGTGDALALSSTYTLAGQVASATFDLNTEEIVAYLATLPASWRQGSAVFEVKVVSADESSVQTVAQLVASIRRPVMPLSDAEPPPADIMLYVLKSALFDADGRPISPAFVGVRAEITSAAQHRAVLTVGRSRPWVILTLEDGVFSAWTLRTRVDGEVDDVANYRVPTDYHVSTNPVIWVRSALS